MFPIEVIEAVKAHAIECLPEESCGIVAGGRYHPCVNEHATPLEHFRIDPRRVVELRNSCGSIEAVVHSHPGGPDYPSYDDQREQIAMQMPWGICVVDPEGESAQDPFWWGDQLPVAPFDTRRFRWGIHDCYGLVRDWLRLNRGIMLKNIPREHEFWNSGSSVIMDHYEEAGFVQIPEIELPGDCGLYRIRSTVVNHTAVYIGEDLMYHHFPGRLPVTEIVGRWMKYMTHAMRYVGDVA